MAMDMQAIMRQAQKMQNDMNRVQDELRQTEVEGIASGGLVKVKATCANEIIGLEISPEIVNPDDVEILQDLILVAINNAMAKATDIATTRMNAVTGGMKLPF